MRYLSGIQPSGTPHLGNYFGAMRQHVLYDAACDLALAHDHRIRA